LRGPWERRIGFPRLHEDIGEENERENDDGRPKAHPGIQTLLPEKEDGDGNRPQDEDRLRGFGNG
jgi:hypothetical protein